MVINRHVTGSWVHVIDDGIVDEDSLPDEALPTGHVQFVPLGPAVAVAGQPATAYTVAPTNALVVEGVLHDLQGREGVWLPGEIGGHTIRWRATTHLEWRDQELDFPVLEFDLTDDARLTGVLANTEPGQPPIVIDPRIEGLISDAFTVLGDAQGVLADAQAVQAGIDTAFDDAVNAAEGHASAAGQSASDAAGSASAAAGSAQDASSSASAAAGSASDASQSATAAAGSASVASGAASAAADSASAAASSAGEADGHADRAESAADEFGLTATASTSAPGTSASVTVSGAGPAYGLDFTIPRGDKGDTGPPGEVSQAMLDAAVASLVDGAPEALDTLSELAQALGGDPNFATTVSEAIGRRAKTVDVDSALADKADVGHSHAWAEVTSKPDEFPPESHSHSYGSLTGKPTEFPPESHTHTPAEVGLGNVDNTADVDKPVSTAQQQALDGKIQLVSDFPASPTPGVLYLKAED